MDSYNLDYDDYVTNFSTGMRSLLTSSEFSDVTLAVEGKFLQVHKVVLSIFSPYFRQLFSLHPGKHTILFLKDVRYTIMRDLLMFIYEGRVQIQADDFKLFVETATELKIKGLTEEMDCANEVRNVDVLEVISDEKTEGASEEVIGEQTNVNNASTSKASEEGDNAHPTLDAVVEKATTQRNALTPKALQQQGTNREETYSLTDSVMDDAMSAPASKPLKHLAKQNDETSIQAVLKKCKIMSNLSVQVVAEAEDSTKMNMNVEPTQQTYNDNNDAVIEIDRDEEAFVPVMDGPMNVDAEQQSPHQVSKQSCNQAGKTVAVTLCNSGTGGEINSILIDGFRYHPAQKCRTWIRWQCAQGGHTCSGQVVLLKNKRIVFVGAHDHEGFSPRLRAATSSAKSQHIYSVLPFDAWEDSASFTESSRKRKRSSNLNL